MKDRLVHILEKNNMLSLVILGDMAEATLR